MFSSRFMLFPTLKKIIIWCKKKIPGGGWIFFFRKTILSHFTFYAILTLKTFTYWLNGRWFLQIVEGQLESISIISSTAVPPFSWHTCHGRTFFRGTTVFPCSDFVSQMWGWFGGGGGVMFFSHFMLFPTFLEKIIWEYKPIISHLMFSSRFFLYAGNIEKVPLHLQLLVKWEVVSPNSRYRAFYNEIGNIEKCPFTYWLNGGGGFSKS